MNEVDNLLTTPFSRRPIEEKLELKRLGQHHPTDVPIVQKSTGSVKSRAFSADSWFKKKPWLTISLSKKSIFCFPCILFGGEESWTKIGITDLKHLSERITKHGSSSKHINNKLQLETFGKVNILSSLNEGHRSAIIRHNQNVDKNRHVFNEIINCLKFSGAHELPLKGHDEGSDSKNQGVFLGLVDLVARLDSQIADHLENATVFKGTSHRIQNELLECMFSIYRENIQTEIQEAAFVSIQADDTTDVSCVTQSVLILRYIADDHKIVERFHGFLQPLETTAAGLSSMILSEIKAYGIKEKLIAQTYDGAAVMSGRTAGVQARIRTEYPNAVFVHCYAHQLNLIIQKAASSINAVKVFFANLSAFPKFFSMSPKRSSVLHSITSQRVARGSATRWNFRSRTVNSVFQMKEDLKECFKLIINGHGWDHISISEASGLTRWLQDSKFLFFLDFFSKIFPHVELLFAVFQSRNSSLSLVSTAVAECVEAIQAIRDQVDDIPRNYTVPDDSHSRSSNSSPSHTIAAKEACDLICQQLSDRFSSSDYVQSFKIIDPTFFADNSINFPEQYLNLACRTYPTLRKEKLRTELTILYSNGIFAPLKTVLCLHKFFINHNLMETFSEVFKLVQITLTTPVSSAEAERCFSTLKRIKTWLRNSMGHERLNALAMLAIHADYVSGINGFNKSVIQKFARLKNRRMNFLYK